MGKDIRGTGPQAEGIDNRVAPGVYACTNDGLDVLQRFGAMVQGFSLSNDPSESVRSVPSV